VTPAPLPRSREDILRRGVFKRSNPLLGVPLIGVGPLYRHDYFTQTVAAGRELGQLKKVLRPCYRRSRRPKCPVMPACQGPGCYRSAVRRTGEPARRLTIRA
jgi:hypothetical protein